jgi:hypothetical protein
VPKILPTLEFFSNFSLEFKKAVEVAIDNVLSLVKQNQLITENTTDPEMVRKIFPKITQLLKIDLFGNELPNPFLFNCFRKTGSENLTNFRISEFGNILMTFLTPVLDGDVVSPSVTWLLQVRKTPVDVAQQSCFFSYGEQSTSRGCPMSVPLLLPLPLPFPFPFPFPFLFPFPFPSPLPLPSPDPSPSPSSPPSPP